MKTLIPTLALTTLLAAAPAWGAVDYFLKIDTIDGESADRDHKDWIDIDSWSWGVLRPPPQGGGGTVSRPVFQDFSWQQAVDKSIVPLFVGLSTGKQYKEATLDVTSGGVGSTSFFQMVFSGVQATRLLLNGAGQTGADAAFNYEKVTLRYRSFDPKGGTGPWIEGSFDLGTGEAVFDGDPQVVQGLLLSGGRFAVDAAAFVPGVPEPGTWAMLALGLAALAAVARRRAA